MASLLSNPMIWKQKCVWLKPHGFNPQKSPSFVFGVSGSDPFTMSPKRGRDSMFDSGMIQVLGAKYFASRPKNPRR